MWAKGAGVQPSTGRRPVGGCAAVHGAAGIVHISTRQHSPKVQEVGGVGGREAADDLRARAAQGGSARGSEAFKLLPDPKSFLWPSWGF